MPDKEAYIAPSWDRIYEMLLDLALRIRNSGFKPDYIVGVSRGGWAPGRILSDLLENSHTVNIKIEFYLGIGKTAQIPEITQPLSEDIAQKYVLVVDDVADSGRSMQVAVEHMIRKGASGVKTATVYYKPQSIFKPDFYADSTPDWIIFPWERLEATKLMIREAKAQGRNVEWVRTTLIECGIHERTVDALLQLANSGT
jgi:uncharacterized protein